MLTDNEIDEIGETIYDALSADERAFLTEALKVTQVHEGDSFHSALGSLDFGYPVGQCSGEITEEDLRRLCSTLVWIRMDPRTSDGDWSRLLTRAFGDSHPRIASLYAAVGIPAAMTDVH